MIVIDASAAIAVVVDRAGDDAVSEELSAPHLIDSEVLNGLRNLEIRGCLSPADAEEAAAAFAELQIERFSAEALRWRIWQLRHTLSAYDATYVALAERLEAGRLLTADRKLARADGPRCRIQLLW